VAASSPGEARFEILEHTADVGLRIRASGLRELFEMAARGMVDILGAAAGAGSSRRGESIAVRDSDLGGLLVDWLNEILFLVDRDEACVAEIVVERAIEDEVVGTVEIAECSAMPEGTELEVATYHRLSVERESDGFVATVYFDV
jgi:SHS2 domain-containing protein